MNIPKRMALGISGLAFAGATALTLGAAAPAGAQTASNAPQHSHSIISHLIGCGGGWDWCFDDCFDDCWC